MGSLNDLKKTHFTIIADNDHREYDKLIFPDDMDRAIRIIRKHKNISHASYVAQIKVSKIIKDIDESLYDEFIDIDKLIEDTERAYDLAVFGLKITCDMNDYSYLYDKFDTVGCGLAFKYLIRYLKLYRSNELAYEVMLDRCDTIFDFIYEKELV